MKRFVVAGFVCLSLLGAGCGPLSSTTDQPPAPPERTAPPEPPPNVPLPTPVQPAS